MNITVPLTDEQAERLNRFAESLGVDPAELARAACVDLLSQPARDFRDAAAHVLEKNRELYRRLAAYQQKIVQELLAALHRLAAVSQPAAPQMADLPPGLVRRFVGQEGRWLIKVYGKGNLWDMTALARFVGDVRSVDPRVTGNPLQAFEASRQMLRSYLKAGFYSLVAVTLILVADFRSLRFALLALLPVGLGMLQMFGLLGLLGVPLNPANMIVLPLILGIGIDDGVHVIHDYRAQKGSFRITDSTATAIVMTSLTSMIGFGSLMIAGHRGLESLGRVLTIGVASCLIMSLGTLTALLVCVSRRRGGSEDRLAGSERSDGPEAETHGHRCALTRPPT